MIRGDHQVFDEQGNVKNRLGKKYLVHSGKTIFISTGGNCDLEQAFTVIVDKISPGGNIKGMIEARRCARKRKKMSEKENK